MSYLKGADLKQSIPQFRPNVSIAKVLVDALQRNGDATGLVTFFKGSFYKNTRHYLIKLYSRTFRSILTDLRLTGQIPLFSDLFIWLGLNKVQKYFT